jgi:glycosyltransferase involved in cell wall biosynthesis
MKYSVLLPTRDGGAQLETAIASVLRSERADVELVVSDNASGPETVAVLDRWRQHARLVVVRRPTPVPVADNWQTAFDASTGNHLLVIGDDDCLLPGYFERLDELLADAPDAISYNAHGFVACGGLRGDPRAHWTERLFPYAASMDGPRVLSSVERDRIVRDLYRFRPTLPLNMQTTLFTRVAAARVPTPLFRAPFPDHFALASMLLTARDWLVVDEPLLVVGLTPKSFGHYAYGASQNDGLEYLGIDLDFDGRVAGDPLLNGMYLWLRHVKREFPAALRDVRIDRGEYVLRQIWWSFRGLLRDAIPFRQTSRTLGSISIGDWMLVARALIRPSNIRRAISSALRARSHARSVWHNALILDGLCTAAEFLEWLSLRPGQHARGRGRQ